MKLSALLSFLDEAGTMPPRWGCAVLVRDRVQPAESERAYTMVPVVAITGDDSGRAVDIVTADVKSRKRVEELTARDAASKLKRLAQTHASARVYAAHPGHDHVRIAGATADSDIGALAFVEWFKGIENEL